MAEIKTMLEQVMTTLHSLRVQGAVSSDKSTDPQSGSEAQSTTGEMESMDICIDDSAQTVTPKRDGTTVSLSGKCLAGTNVLIINLLLKRRIFARTSEAATSL